MQRWAVSSSTDCCLFFRSTSNLSGCKGEPCKAICTNTKPTFVYFTPTKKIYWRIFLCLDIQAQAGKFHVVLVFH